MAGQLIEQAVGIGVDVVDVGDFERVSLQRSPGFYKRCFSESEIAYCSAQARPAQHFAARFAAKEAAVKALATHSQLAYWQIEVERGPDGQPDLALWTYDRSAPLAEMQGLDLKVSLSHADVWAAAMVVAFSKDPTRAE
ncbi:MAG: holo-ACP synthase [Chloroflexota bacterium]